MSGTISTSTIDEVTRRLNISDIIGRYVQIRRSGRKFVALCPFHREKTPSLHIDPDKGLWYCFGCHEGGTVYNFVMRMEGLSFPDAVRRLAEEVGVAIESGPSALQENSERLRALELLERAASFYHTTLLESPAGQPGREYMVSRGISKETAIKFRLGWAPDSGTTLLRTLKNAGFDADEAVKCGLITKNSYGYGDLLRNRLIFPICDSQGKVLAFGGRILGDGLPKYINTPETPWYSKRHNLYGLSQARSAISRQDVAVLVEGYFDVISLHQVGVHTAVASLGTSLTEEQAVLLRRYCQNVILAYDSDSAGQNAALRGNDVLEEAELKVQIVQMPVGEDPDSLSARGIDEVQRVLQSAVGVVDFQMDKLMREMDITTPEGKEDFVKATMKFVRKIRDSVRQDAYIRRLAYYTGVSETRLHWRLRGNRQIVKEHEPTVRRLSSEEELLIACMSMPSWIEVAREFISLDMIDDCELRAYFERLFALEDTVHRHTSITLSELMSGCYGYENFNRLAELLARPEMRTSREDICKLAASIRDKRWKERLEALRLEIIPALNEGKLELSDPRYIEYCNLRKHFHTSN